MYPMYLHLREMALLYSQCWVFFRELRVTDGRKARQHLRNSKDHHPVHEIPSLKPYPRPHEFRKHIIPYYPQTILTLLTHLGPGLSFSQENCAYTMHTLPYSCRSCYVPSTSPHSHNHTNNHVYIHRSARLLRHNTTFFTC